MCKVVATHEEIVRSSAADLALILSNAMARALDRTAALDGDHSRPGTFGRASGQAIRRSMSSWLRGLSILRSARVAPK